MFRNFQQSELNKAQHIFQRHAAVAESLLDESDPDLKVFRRQKEFLRQGRFNWQQEVELLGVNLT